MPGMEDPYFAHTLTYVCEHNGDGALGIIVNRPVEVRLGEIFSHMGIKTENPKLCEQPVYFGGPVQQERGFVLHRPVGIWDASLPIADNIAITTSRDILVALASGQGPEEALIAMGYSGWGAGQLEKEMAENTWLAVPADGQLIFNTPPELRWEMAARWFGIDLRLLSPEAGHA